MSDTTVTVAEQDGEKPPTTPDTVAETAVAAIGETARSAASASTDARTADNAAYQSSDAAEQARLHAEAAARSESAIATWATSITDAVAAIPTKIGETLQALVTNAPASEPPATPAPTETKTKVTPQQHWATKPLFKKGGN